MKQPARRFVSILLAMAMALSLTAPVVAEHLDEETAPETSTVTIQEEDTTQEDAAEEQLSAAPAEADQEEDDSNNPVQEEDAAQGEESVQEPMDEITETAEPLQKQEESTEDAQPLDQAITLKALETAQLPTNDPATVLFDSSDDTVVTVDETGLIQAQHVGQAVITAVDTQGEVTSFPVEVKSTTTKSKKSLHVGGKTTLKLKGRTLLSAQTDDERIAEVDLKGKVTACRSGVVDITLTDTLGDMHVCTLTVKGVLSTQSLSLSETEKEQLSFKGSDIRQAKSSDEDVVTVDDEGVVEAIREGTAVLTLKDRSGSTAKCTVKVEPNYLARTAKHAKRIYSKIEKLRCRHVSGVHTYSQLVKRKHCSCTTGPSLALQAAGVLPVGKTVSHTKAGSERRKLKSVDKGISCRKNLKKGTYTIYKANCRFSRLPKKYKQAGMVYVQDSNICVSAGDGYIYSCNESSRQYRHGHYFRTKMKAGYTHHHKILYVIAPNS